MIDSMQGRGANAADDATADREIVQIREFDAPRELVWAAFTEPDHFPHWFGPRGFTITLHEMDVRVGGRNRFIMHGPDGTDYPNRMDYLEVVRPERLVFWHSDDLDDDPNRFHVTVTFEDLGGRTRLTMRSLFATPEARAAVVSFGAIELGAQTLDKLAEWLERRS